MLRGVTPRCKLLSYLSRVRLVEVGGVLVAVAAAAASATAAVAAAPAAIAVRVGVGGAGFWLVPRSRNEFQLTPLIVGPAVGGHAACLFAADQDVGQKIFFFKARRFGHYVILGLLIKSLFLLLFVLSSLIRIAILTTWYYYELVLCILLCHSSSCSS